MSARAYLVLVLVVLVGAVGPLRADPTNEVGWLAQIDSRLIDSSYGITAADWLLLIGENSVYANAVLDMLASGLYDCFMQLEYHSELLEILADNSELTLDELREQTELLEGIDQTAIDILGELASMASQDVSVRDVLLGDILAAIQAIDINLDGASVEISGGEVSVTQGSGGAGPGGWAVSDAETHLLLQDANWFLSDMSGNLAGMASDTELIRGGLEEAYDESVGAFKVTIVDTGGVSAVVTQMVGPSAISEEEYQDENTNGEAEVESAVDDFTTSMDDFTVAQDELSDEKEGLLGIFSLELPTIGKESSIDVPFPDLVKRFGGESGAVVNLSWDLSQVAPLAWLRTVELWFFALLTFYTGLKIVRSAVA